MLWFRFFFTIFWKKILNFFDEKTRRFWNRYRRRAWNMVMQLHMCLHLHVLRSLYMCFHIFNTVWSQTKKQMITYFGDLIILISYRTTLIVLWILHRFLSTRSRALCLHITFPAHVFLYMRVNEWVKHLHDRIISLRREVRAHKTSLTRPLFIEVYVPRQESERLYICVLGVSISSFTCFRSIFYFQLF